METETSCLVLVLFTTRKRRNYIIKKENFMPTNAYGELFEALICRDIALPFSLIFFCSCKQGSSLTFIGQFSLFSHQPNIQEAIELTACRSIWNALAFMAVTRAHECFYNIFKCALNLLPQLKKRAKNLSFNSGHHPGSFADIIPARLLGR
ncbi:hypothetical protein CEXT_531161 [Caerostris extrusa]|uniref:Uncharacterized protein n=1 Tax=Caerostris extrusa TaxID=172846 RepID=A0AAV4XH17_CAEEX|nr:hypothetical protein CEXT_531161 [Caerostris extrusa]